MHQHISHKEWLDVMIYFGIPWFCCLFWCFGLFGGEVFVVYSINCGKNDMMQETGSNVRAWSFEASCQGLLFGKCKVWFKASNPCIFLIYLEIAKKSHSCCVLSFFHNSSGGRKGFWNRNLKHQIVTEVIQFHWCVSSWKAQDLYSNMM